MFLKFSAFLKNLYRRYIIIIRTEILILFLGPLGVFFSEKRSRHFFLNFQNYHKIKFLKPVLLKNKIPSSKIFKIVNSNKILPKFRNIHDLSNSTKHLTETAKINPPTCSNFYQTRNQSAKKSASVRKISNFKSSFKMIKSICDESIKFNQYRVGVNICCYWWILQADLLSVGGFKKCFKRYFFFF